MSPVYTLVSSQLYFTIVKYIQTLVSSTCRQYATISEVGARERETEKKNQLLYMLYKYYGGYTCLHYAPMSAVRARERERERVRERKRERERRCVRFRENEREKESVC